MTEWSPASRRPLRTALVLASMLFGGLAVLLTFNEDLRRTTFVLLERVVDEEGNEEVRVKVARPEPTERQVREMTRHRERVERERLREQARKVRRAVEEIENLNETLDRKLTERSVWDRAQMRLRELREMSDRVEPHWLGRSGFPLQEALAERMALRRTQMEESAALLREFTAAEPEAPEVEGLRERAQRLVEDFRGMRVELENDRDQVRKEKERWNFEAERLQSQTLEQMAGEYLAALPPPPAEFDPNAAENGEVVTALPPPGPLAPPEDWRDALPDDGELDAMTVDELYTEIQEMTEWVDDAFARQRAAELASIEGLQAEEALSQVHAPRTDIGPDLAGELREANPNDLESFEQFQEALNQAGRAGEHMARAAENRRRQATEHRPGTNPEGGQDAASLRQALAARSEMRGFADTRGRPQGDLQDLSGLMLQAYGGFGDSGSSSAPHGDVILSHTFLTDLGTPRGQEGTPGPRLNLNQIMREALPGRRLDSQSERRGWIFLDTWYVIGPWPRPRSDSYSTRFPPEFAVDLDATYSGKPHPRSREPLELRWRFVQTENIRVNPPDEISDAVYYGYTELYSDRDREVVLAVASDDMAKLWINDLVVWEDHGLSPWRLDEGFRRVQLKAGYNRFLIRVENGPVVCHFSVLLCPPEAL